MKYLLVRLPQLSVIEEYSWMDLNHLKAANLAEKVYKTSLTTKSHEQENLKVYK